MQIAIVTLLALVGLILVIYALAIWLAPFPYWPTYWRLWRNVLGHRDPALTLGCRFRHIRFLLRYLLLCPLWTFLWYLDELLFPSYRQEVVRGPVYVIGQPRSGTTFLHRTLAADEEHFLAVRHYEWRFPFLAVQKSLRWLRLTPRIARIDYWPGSPTGRDAAKMHGDRLGDWEEDGIFFEERFLHHYFVYRRFPYPGLMPHLHEFSALPPKVQERFLRIHKRVLQKILYLRGSGRIVLLKENESMEMIRRMPDAYPDLTFLIITRHKEDFLKSYVTLSITSTRCKTGVDPRRIGGWQEMNLWKRREECRRQVQFFEQCFPRERQVRLSYSVFLGNIADSVAHVYDRLDLSIDASRLERLKSLQEQQGKRDRGYDVVDNGSPETFAFYDEFVSRIETEHQAQIAADGQQERLDE